MTNGMRGKRDTSADRDAEPGSGLTRRELFKVGAAAAGVGAGAFVLGVAVPAGSARAAASNFQVVLPAFPALSASAVGFAMDPVTFKNRPRKVGKARFGNANFVIEPNSAADTEIQSWLSAARNGDCIRQDISIQLFDSLGTPERTFELHDCSPLRFSFDDVDTSPSSDGVVRWSLEVRVSRISMA